MKVVRKYFNIYFNRDVDAFEGLTNSIIASLLVDGPTSPFYQALIEPNIGSDYSPATGLEFQYEFENTFHCLPQESIDLSF